MQRSRSREAEFRGEITAFLALIFMLMMSLVGALIESASIQISKNRKRADTLLALESVFAEYDRDVFEGYDIFVRKEQDGGGIEKRLEYYGTYGTEHSIVKKELLTDYGGQPFFRQAVTYMKELIGIKGDASREDYHISEGELVEAEETEVFDKLEQMLDESGEMLPEEENPISSIQNLKKANLLTLVSEHPENISKRTIQLENLPTQRQLKEGNYGVAHEGSVEEKLLFIGYLLKHFGNAVSNEEEGALIYEQEYLLGGRASDEENLEYVCKKIVYLRMAINYGYLITDAAKQAEAEAMALSLCSLLTVPQITEVVKHALLLAWAYGESIVDVRTLLKGEKVPLIKTAENWQLQLINLAKLGTTEEVIDEKEDSGGWGYQMYLAAVLAITDQEDLCMRSLDLIESNLEVRTDECMTKVEIKSTVTLRRGVTDRFNTKYGYQ